MADWCCAYVDNVDFSKMNVGGIQHGTFYATVQALLFVICYRYHEFHGSKFFFVKLYLLNLFF